MNRRRSFFLWLSTCFIIIFVILNTRSSTELSKLTSIMEKHNPLEKLEDSHADDQWNQILSKGISFQNQIGSAVTAAHRYVTPSLAELGSRGRLPYMYKHVLMLTRIPGTGAELIVLILQRLQGYNAFKHIRLPSGDHGLLSTLQQELLVEEITSIIKQEAVPLSFDGDVRFLNFSVFGRQGPTFISLVRNPLDPRIWQKYIKREKRMPYHGAISHFCGQEPRCMERNNTWALAQAKANVIQWYPVVGILDYMEESLKAFAFKFPYFFKDAIRMYDQFRPREKYSSVPLALNLRIKDAFLKKALAQEVEFYQWLKSRLLNKTFNKNW